MRETPEQLHEMMVQFANSVDTEFEEHSNNLNLARFERAEELRTYTRLFTNICRWRRREHLSFWERVWLHRWHAAFAVALTSALGIGVWLGTSTGRSDAVQHIYRTAAYHDYRHPREWNSYVSSLRALGQI